MDLQLHALLGNPQALEEGPEWHFLHRAQLAAMAFAPPYFASSLINLKMTMTAPVRLFDALQGPVVSVVGDTYRIVVSGEQSGGTHAIIDMLVPPNGGPGPHAHAAIQESFYVVAGEIVVRTQTDTYTAKPGDFVTIPKGGAVHSFKNESAATAHLLCVVVPAGLDAFFLAIGQPVAAGTFLPPSPPSAQQMEQWQVIAKEYGQQVFPPDFLAH